MTLWLALLPSGFGIVLLLLRMRAVATGKSVHTGSLVKMCLGVALVCAAEAFVGGSDVSRIAWAAGPFVWAVALGLSAVSSGSDVDTVCAVAGSVVLWRPWHVFTGSAMQYLRYFLPQYWGGWSGRFAADRLVVVVVAAAWICARTSQAVARRTVGAASAARDYRSQPQSVT